MSAISSISLSGMNAAQTSLSASALNIANLGTDGFRRQQVEQTTVPTGVSTTVQSAQVPGDAIVTDMVDLLQAKSAFLANLAVFKADMQMAGTLLDAIG